MGPNYSRPTKVCEHPKNDTMVIFLYCGNAKTSRHDEPPRNINNANKTRRGIILERGSKIKIAEVLLTVPKRYYDIDKFAHIYNNELLLRKYIKFTILYYINNHSFVLKIMSAHRLNSCDIGYLAITMC